MASYSSGIFLLHLIFLLILNEITISTASEEKTTCPFAFARGHMKPFGYHAKKWRRVEARSDFVSPEEFYKKYVRPSKPVVIRGGIANWPAVERWSNLTYLAEISGDILMSADWKKIYNEHEYMTAHSVRREVTMKEYIRRMNSENIYMDTPITEPLLKDMFWPQLTNCEYFIHKMRTPSFFFNTGKSNTDIHIDSCETLFFQVAGSRLWLMTPPNNAYHMYAGRVHFPHHDGISAINQTSVNLTTFPEAAKSVIHAAVVNKGDLIYVPEAWFHNVIAKGNPNIATTIFFDSSNCMNLITGKNEAEYANMCDLHRKIFLPSGIECPKKLPPGTTWLDVFQNYQKVNKKIKPVERTSEKSMSEELQKSLKKVGFKAIGKERKRYPRMILEADLIPLLDTLSDKTKSILQTKYRFFIVHFNDIQLLEIHLFSFNVSREDIFIMVIVPHDVSEDGPGEVQKWMENMIGGFSMNLVGKFDFVLLEAPPCKPKSPMDQDCDRDSAMNLLMLSSWQVLESYKQRGIIQHLGVKDFSPKELTKLQAVAQEEIAVVCLRFDPLFRQPKLMKAVKKVGAASMVHSVIGSGWIRDGIAKENPLFAQKPFLDKVFQETGSVYSYLYGWALRQGHFVIPELATNGVTAEINFDAMLSHALDYFIPSTMKAIDRFKLPKYLMDK